MDQFHLSPVKRLVSRFYFYGTILTGSFLIGNMLPTEKELQQEADRRIGAAKAYYGVPISKVPAQVREREVRVSSGM